MVNSFFPGVVRGRKGSKKMWVRRGVGGFQEGRSNLGTYRTKG